MLKVGFIACAAAGTNLDVDVHPFAPFVKDGKILHNSISPVILSGVAGSRSEPAAQSKDPSSRGFGTYFAALPRFR
jgi:hypothetical protein